MRGRGSRGESVLFPFSVCGFVSWVKSLSWGTEFAMACRAEALEHGEV